MPDVYRPKSAANISLFFFKFNVSSFHMCITRDIIAQKLLSADVKIFYADNRYYRLALISNVSCILSRLTLIPNVSYPMMYTIYSTIDGVLPISTSVAG